MLEDETLRGKLDDLFWEMIKWRSLLLAERAAWVTYGDDVQRSIRWREGETEKHLEKPDT